jgi:hypothetical protein
LNGHFSWQIRILKRGEFLFLRQTIYSFMKNSNPIKDI